MTAVSNESAQNQSGESSQVVSNFALSLNTITLMRVLGMVLLLTAGFTFLVQSWQGMNHFLRFCSSAGFALLLLTAGHFLANIIQECRGARAFMILALLSVPILFSEVGGMLYAFIGNSPFDSQFWPPLFVWPVPTLSELFGALFVAAGVSSVLTYTAFPHLLERNHREATIAFLIVNFIIFLPLRGDLSVAICFALAIGLGGFFELTWKLTQAVRKGVSKNIVIALFLAPPCLIVARAVFLHSPGFFTEQAIALFLGSFLFFLVGRPTNGVSFWQHVGAFLLLESLYDVTQYALPFHDELVTVAVEFFPLLSVSGGMLVLARKTGSFSSLYVSGAHAILLFTVYDTFFAGIEWYQTLYTISVASLLLVCSASRKNSFLLFFSGVALGVSLLRYLSITVFAAAEDNPWIFVGVLGVVTILGASLYEKYGSRMWAAAHKHFSSK